MSEKGGTSAPKEPGGCPATVPKGDLEYPPNASTKLFVSNCPSDITDDDIMELFSDFKDSICKITWARNDDRGFAGYGWVDFNNLGLAVQAQMLNETLIRGKEIIISYSQPKRSMDEDPPCEHKEWGDWKRLRQKNGLQHFVCIHCGTKWKRATIARKEAESLRTRKDNQNTKGPQCTSDKPIDLIPARGLALPKQPYLIPKPQCKNNYSMTTFPSSQTQIIIQPQGRPLQPVYQTHQPKPMCNQPPNNVVYNVQHINHQQITPNPVRQQYNYNAFASRWISKPPPLPSQPTHLKRLIINDENSFGPPSPIRAEFRMSAQRDLPLDHQNAPLSPPHRPRSAYIPQSTIQTPANFIFKDQGAFNLSSQFDSTPPTSPYNRVYRAHPSPSHISSPNTFNVNAIHSSVKPTTPLSKGKIITVRTRNDSTSTPKSKLQSPAIVGSLATNNFPQPSPNFEIQWIRNEFTNLQHKIQAFGFNSCMEDSAISSEEKLQKQKDVVEGYGKLIEEANLLIRCLSNLYIGLTTADSALHKEMQALKLQVQAESWR